MTKRTRVFLSVAVGILVIGLGSGLLASYMGLQNLTLTGGGGLAELSYVPADARFLAYANVRDVMDSDVRRRLSELHPGTNNGADEFKEHTGIDLETDVDYVVAAGVAGPEQGPPLVLARGRFDEARIEALVTEHGGNVEDYKGSRLLVRDETIAVAFLEPGLAAIGTSAAVRRAIDTKADGTDVRGNDDLMRLVGEIDNGDAWAVARFDALTTGTLPAEVASQLPQISWFSATGFIDTGVEGQLRVETRDEESAQNLREVLRGFVALARMQAGQHAELGAALDGLQLGGEGRTVSLSFSVPSEMIDALGALRAERPRLPRPALQPPPASTSPAL